MKVQHIRSAENSNHELRMYEIYKGFRVRVIEPESYLLKTIGIDCDRKKAEQKKPKLILERVMSGHQDFFCTCGEMSVSKKRTRRRRTLKKKRHEELEETV